MGVLLTAIVVAGFVPPMLARPGGIASVPLLLQVHGAVFVAWFLLFCVQAGLVTSGRVRLHRRLGATSVVLAVAIVFFGYLVTRGAYARPGFSIAGLSQAGSVIFPFTDIVNFVIAYSLAVYNRRSPAAHKRLMLLAGILMIDPAASRLVFTLGGTPPFILLFELGLLLALIGYDLYTRRRPSWATLVGTGLFVAAFVAKLTIANHPAWQAFADVLFG
ncbi:MAG: hypothetical protein V2I25_05760 [Woeseiaceae bacterium]|jgi:hypothetical protein|nr:hypothetical protein [Woeseiaceae bacterium]